MRGVTTALQAMADPHRWRLLCELARSDRRVSELTALVGTPQNLVSYHLRELRNAGLVSSRRSSFDGRDAYYRIDLGRCGEELCAAAEALDRGMRLQAAPPRPLSRPSWRPSSRRRVRVLFLCTGNSARSQMAEALLEQLAGPAVEARSAGSHPKPLHPGAVRVMAERGVDLSAKAPKHLRRFARARFDLVVTLCDKVREVCPEFPGAPETVHWSVPDPSTAGDTAAFEQVAADLEVRIRQLIARLGAIEGGTAHAR